MTSTDLLPRLNREVDHWLLSCDRQGVSNWMPTSNPWSRGRTSCEQGAYSLELISCGASAKLKIHETGATGEMLILQHLVVDLLWRPAYLQVRKEIHKGIDAVLFVCSAKAP